MRQEIGGRLVEKVYGSDDKPSKVQCTKNYSNLNVDHTKALSDITVCVDKICRLCVCVCVW